jgi:hypothetical protein
VLNLQHLFKKIWKYRVKCVYAPSKKGPGLVNSNRLYKKVYPRGFYECTFKLYVVFIYIIAFTMASQFMNSVADTLTKKPEYGIVSSMLSITMSTTEVLQLVGIIIGLFIAVITAVLKVMELREKLAEKRKARRLKKLVEEAREEEEE